MTAEEQDEFLYQLKGKKKGGHLSKWCHCKINQGQVIGVITGHYKHPDGSVVRCSKTIGIHEYEGKKILETLNSFYYLEDEGTDEDLDRHYQMFYKDTEKWFR